MTIKASTTPKLWMKKRSLTGKLNLSTTSNLLNTPRVSNRAFKTQLLVREPSNKLTKIRFPHKKSLKTMKTLMWRDKRLRSPLRNKLHKRAQSPRKTAPTTSTTSQITSLLTTRTPWATHKSAIAALATLQCAQASSSTPYHPTSSAWTKSSVHPSWKWCTGTTMS